MLGKGAENGDGKKHKLKQHLGPDPSLLAAKERERQEEEHAKAQARRKQPCVPDLLVGGCLGM